jgi:Lactonase, 7-bladed beta-propeller
MTDNFQSVGNGTGPNPARQEGPHAHQILTDLDGNHVFGVDLGADKVNVWNLNPVTGKLIQNTVPFVPIASADSNWQRKNPVIVSCFTLDVEPSRYPRQGGSRHKTGCL